MCEKYLQAFLANDVTLHGEHISYVNARRSCLEIQLFLWQRQQKSRLFVSCSTDECKKQCLSEQRKQAILVAGGSDALIYFANFSCCCIPSQSLAATNCGQIFAVLSTGRGFNLSLVPALLGLLLLLLLLLPGPQIGGRVVLAVLDPDFHLEAGR